MGNEEAEDTSVVDYAIYNEFGTERSPARPFMSTTYDLYSGQLEKFTHFLVGRMIDGKVTDDTVLKNIGAKYQSWIQKTIRDAKNWAVPNSPKTVAMKGSSSPLIDQGRMVQAVRYEVE